MQLQFDVINHAGGVATPLVIFVSADPTFNLVDLEVQLASGSTTLTPGTIPDPQSPPGTGTTFYLDLSALEMAADVWTRIAVTSPDWEFATFPSKGLVGLTPRIAIPLSAGTSGLVTISIAGITVPQPLSQPEAQISVTFFGVPGVRGSFFFFSVSVRKPSGGNDQDLADAVAASTDNNGIVASVESLPSAENHFSLILSNADQTAVPQAGPNTSFDVSFVYGSDTDPDGFGALTSRTASRQILVTAGVNASQWQINPHPDDRDMHWTLQPPSGAPLVGSGQDAVVAIHFSNVVTFYQPGPTTMLISYSDVPGFRDGAYSLVLNKVAHAVVRSLTVTPNPAFFSNGAAAVTVSWTVDGAERLMLSQGQAPPTDVTGELQRPATLDAEVTEFQLTATGAQGTVDNTDQKSLPAVVLPVIRSFAGTPTEIFSGTDAYTVAFQWDVDSPSGVTISSTGSAFDGQSFSSKGSSPASITEPQLVTMAADAADPSTAPTRRLVISAFTPAGRNFRIFSHSFSTLDMALTPDGDYAVVSDAVSMEALVVDTTEFAVVGTINIRFPGVAEFSPDGTTFAVLTSPQDVATVSIFNVTRSADGKPQFGPPAVVSVTGSENFPSRITYSPDGRRIFVTSQVPNTPSSAAFGQVTSFLRSGDAYQLEAALNVGTSPSVMTFDVTATRLFVSDEFDSAIYSIALDANGRPGEVTPIHVPGRPACVTTHPNGRQLLVACQSNTIVVLDPSHLVGGQQKSLHVGGSPTRIAITPDGAYAFVLNADAGAVSLISCPNLPNDAEVLVRTINYPGQDTTGSQARSIGLKPDGGSLLIPVSSGVAVLTLATYELIATRSVPNHPTNVAFSRNGAVAVAWQDVSIADIAPGAGVQVFNLKNNSLTTVFEDKSLLRCTTSRAAPSPAQAFAIVRSDKTLYGFDMETLATSEFSLQTLAGSVPAALAVPGNGDLAILVTADPALNYSLLLVDVTGTDWQQIQTLDLYKGTAQGRLLLHGAPDGSVLFLIDAAAGQARILFRSGRSYTLADTIIALPGTAMDVTFLADGSTAYILCLAAKRSVITVVDVATRASRDHVVPQDTVRLGGLVSSPDSRRLFATDRHQGSLHILDPQSLRILQTLPFDTPSQPVKGMRGVAIAPDASTLLTANAGSQTLCVVQQIQMGTSRHTQPRACGPAAESEDR